MSRFPLKVNPHGYFEDSDGKPFLWHADTCWRIFWMLPYEDACRYLELRAAQGFNVIQVHLLPHRVFQTNVYGENPFLEQGKMDRPNEAYFGNVDRIIAYAGKLGLGIAMSPSWLSTWEDDWHKMYHTDAARTYAHFAAKRYGAFENVIAFIHGGDDDSIPLHDDVNECAAIYKAEAPQVLATFHAGIGPSYHLFGDEPWYDFCMNYTYHYDDCIRQMTEAKKRYPHKPVVLGETHYDGNGGITAQTLRSYAYTTILFGGSGQTYGNKEIWMATLFFFDYIYTAGSHSMMVLKEFFDRIPWYDFCPDYEGKRFRTLWAKRQDAESTPFPTAVTRDEKEIVAYISDIRFFAAEGNRSYNAEWVDPVSGRSFPFTGRCGDQLTLLGRNAAGDYDWLLHLTFTD